MRPEYRKNVKEDLQEELKAVRKMMKTNEKDWQKYKLRMARDYPRNGTTAGGEGEQRPDGEAPEEEPAEEEGEAEEGGQEQQNLGISHDGVWI